MKNGLRCDDIVAQQDSLTHKTFHKLFIPVNSNLDLLILISRSKPIEPYNEMKTATEGLIKKGGKTTESEYWESQRIELKGWESYETRTINGKSE